MTSTPVLRLALGWLLLMLAVLGGLTRLDFWQQETPLRGPFTPQGGYGYAASFSPRLPLPFLFTTPADSAGDSTRSRLTLYENGQRLPLAHSLHTRIRDEGRGTYSHWGPTVYFSSSDNTPPPANGRTYTARYPLHLAGWAWGLLLVSGLLLTFPRFFRAVWEGNVREHFPLWARISNRWAAPLVTLWGLVFFIHALAILPVVAIFSPDTDSYFSFSSMRTMGYPVILWVMQTLGDHPRALVGVQLAVALGVTAFFTRALETLTRSSLLAFGVGLLLAGKEGLLMLHVYIGPDSFFFSFLTLHLAFGLLLAQRFTTGRAVGFAVCWMLASLLRPSAFGVWPGALVLCAVWLHARRWKPTLIVMFLMSVALSANRVGTTLVSLSAAHKDKDVVAGSVIGTSLFATAGFLLTPDMQVEPVALRDRLVPLLAPMRRAYEAADGWLARYRALNDHYNPVVYAVGLPVAQQWLLEQTGRKPSFPELDRFLLCMSVAIIKADPAAFASLTRVKILQQAENVMTGNWREDVAGSLSYTRQHMMQEIRARAYVEREGYTFTPPADARLLDPFNLKRWINQLRVSFNLAVVFCALAWCVAAGLGLVRRTGASLPPLLVGSAFASAALLSYCLMVSLVQDPLTRYQESVVAYSLTALAGGGALVAAFGRGLWSALMGHTLKRGRARV